MDVNGSLIRYLYRDEKTGESHFTIRSDGKVILCEGVMQYLPKKTPITLIGEYVEREDTTIFKADEIILQGVVYESVCEFLYSDEFPDTGIKTAQGLLQKTGTDIFAFVRNNNDTSTFTDTEKRILNRIRSFTTFEKLLGIIRRYGGHCYSAQKLVNKYEASAYDVMQNNPYVLLFTGADYKLCEEMASDHGMESCDKKRIHAIVMHCMEQNRKEGNTRISFHDLVTKVHVTENKAGKGYYTESLFIGEEILSDCYITEQDQSDFYIYLKEDYEAEELICQNIRRLTTSAIDLDTGAIDPEQIEKECGISYSAGQLSAFRSTKKSGVKFITGGPGTGKTTVINGILKKYELEHPGKKIVLCAPTGRAARRMQEATGRAALTAHKLLDIRPFETKSSYRQKILDADLVVADEGSMFDTYLMARLLCAIKNGATFIVVGDEDQLPSVDAGNVFGDILKSGSVEVYPLDVIFRQNGMNLIVKNSRNIINGNPRLSTDKNFRIHKYHSENEMIEEAVKIAGMYANRGNSDFKLFTPTRKSQFQSGTINMNRLIKRKVNPDPEESVRFGYNVFSVGDTVVFYKNNYEKGYYNGQEGVIRNIQRHNGSTHISVETDDGNISITGLELEDLELGYAITAHKSQGGECGSAIILIPMKPMSMLRRDILYVEVTRAKKEVDILSENDALEKAISSFAEKKRNTGLLQKLKKDN